MDQPSGPAARRWPAAPTSAAAWRETSTCSASLPRFRARPERRYPPAALPAARRPNHHATSVGKPTEGPVGVTVRRRPTGVPPMLALLPLPPARPRPPGQAPAARPSPSTIRTKAASRSSRADRNSMSVATSSIYSCTVPHPWKRCGVAQGRSHGVAGVTRGTALSARSPGRSGGTADLLDTEVASASPCLTSTSIRGRRGAGPVYRGQGTHRADYPAARRRRASSA